MYFWIVQSEQVCSASAFTEQKIASYSSRSYLNGAFTGREQPLMSRSTLSVLVKELNES